jgi:hypothetical protein
MLFTRIDLGFLRYAGAIIYENSAPLGSRTCPAVAGRLRTKTDSPLRAASDRTPQGGRAFVPAR